MMAASAAALVGAAFLRPVLRTIAFVALGAVIFFSYFQVCGLAGADRKAGANRPLVYACVTSWMALANMSLVSICMQHRNVASSETPLTVDSMATGWKPNHLDQNCRPAAARPDLSMSALLCAVPRGCAYSD
jgi:hypothetical protein